MKTKKVKILQIRIILKKIINKVIPYVHERVNLAKEKLVNIKSQKKEDRIEVRKEIICIINFIMYKCNSLVENIGSIDKMVDMKKIVDLYKSQVNIGNHYISKFDMIMKNLFTLDPNDKRTVLEIIDPLKSRMEEHSDDFAASLNPSLFDLGKEIAEIINRNYIFIDKMKDTKVLLYWKIDLDETDVVDIDFIESKFKELYSDLITISNKFINMREFIIEEIAKKIVDINNDILTVKNNRVFNDIMIKYDEIIAQKNEENIATDSSCRETSSNPSNLMTPTAMDESISPSGKCKENGY